MIPIFILLAIGGLVILDFLGMMVSRKRQCPYCHAEQAFKRGFLCWSCCNPRHAEVVESESYL